MGRIVIDRAVLGDAGQCRAAAELERQRRDLCAAEAELSHAETAIRRVWIGEAGGRCVAFNTRVFEATEELRRRTLTG